MPALYTELEQFPLPISLIAMEKLSPQLWEVFNGIRPE